MIGLTGVYTGSVMTSLGLVVRKIKQQSIFSYYWVRDAIDASVKELAERKLLSFEDSLRRSALPSISITASSAIPGSSSSIVNTLSMSGGMSSDKSGDAAPVAVSVSGFTLSGKHRTESIGSGAAAGLSKGVNNMAVLPGISEGHGLGQGECKREGQGQGQERRRRFGISEIQEQLFKKGNVPKIPSVIEESELNQKQEKDLTSQKSSDSGTLFDYLCATTSIRLDLTKKLIFISSFFNLSIGV